MKEIDKKSVNNKIEIIDNLVKDAINSEDVSVAGTFLIEAHKELSELEMHTNDNKINEIYEEFLKLNKVILNGYLHTYSRNFEKINSEYNEFNKLITQ
ncbi:hypothetical protein RD055328_01980 [Companilactobacillus sp. RD055328]|uniref:hypothetical protein n=1 Tax=Companilactobacillus sp. RD055328 TaxID=2916634 RepID=UPI001FC826B2|nr:hypothetical protein [Companilactobacillus sp. RD055328]GKQ42275.1 hypothetical protein RD055328_01980 [Companilactobacillus sp. RD055328]